MIMNKTINKIQLECISPVFDEEDLKLKKLSKNASALQTLQNNMIRLVFDLKKKQHT